jgi:hypothetical protein
MTKDERLTRCDNCGNECTVDELANSLCEMHHLYERLEPGEEVPAGECECGACAYVVKDGPLPVIHTLEVDSWAVHVSRGEDDAAMIVSIDSTQATGPNDHTKAHMPRLHVYVNDTSTYDYTKQD